MCCFSCHKIYNENIQINNLVNFLKCFDIVNKITDEIKFHQTITIFLYMINKNYFTIHILFD
jgi:hypothetical protein